VLPLQPDLLLLHGRRTEAAQRLKNHRDADPEGSERESDEDERDVRAEAEAVLRAAEALPVPEACLLSLYAKHLLSVRAERVLSVQRQESVARQFQQEGEHQPAHQLLSDQWFEQIEQDRLVQQIRCVQQNRLVQQTRKVQQD
jgi:transcription initiation factor TFIID subunit TAF12